MKKEEKGAAETTLWNFRLGDIILCDNTSGIHHFSGSDDERFIIESFSFLTDKSAESLTGRSLYSNKTHLFECRYGLILMERPAWKFKVGDEVETVCPFRGEKGRVIVLDPSSVFPHFLVEMREYNENVFFPWYPEKYKTGAKKRFWFNENELRKIN